jgi:outer membrane lipoprotein-sorting protein
MLQICVDIYRNLDGMLQWTGSLTAAGVGRLFWREAAGPMQAASAWEACAGMNVRMMIGKTSVCTCISAAFLSSALLAAQPSALEIVRKSDAALKGKTEQGRVTMTVVTPDWRRTLEMEIWWSNPNRTFLRITAPAKEAGTATLRIGLNMWNYLPQVERVIKIPPSLMLQPWMGSDFSNDDLVRESSLVNDYNHQLDGEVTAARDPCYRIVSIPKPGAAVVWGKLILSIRKSDYLPRREEFYDESGKLIKVLTFEDIRKIDGRDYPMRWTMTSMTKPGHTTQLDFGQLRFDAKIPDRIFSQENLRQRFPG